jgi:hypothetical protein
MDLYIKKNRKGRGIYAGRTFKKGECILRNPVIIFKDGDAKGLIHQYTFEWDDGTSALALGLGSLMNHSFKPNVTYRYKFRQRELWFIAYREIKKWEELVFNYNHDPDDKTPMKFKVK